MYNVQLVMFCYYLENNIFYFAYAYGNSHHYARA